MNTNEWGLDAWLLIVLNTCVAVGAPIATRVKLANPALLSERILYSRPGEVVTQTVAACVSGCAAGVLFALGGTRFPVLWGTVLIAISAVGSSLWYAALYRRMRRRMEGELEAGSAAERL